jgi:hypothetical protein
MEMQGGLTECPQEQMGHAKAGAEFAPGPAGPQVKNHVPPGSQKCSPEEMWVEAASSLSRLSLSSHGNATSLEGKVWA